MEKAKLIQKIIKGTAISTKERNEIPKIFRLNRNRVLKHLIRLHPKKYYSLRRVADLGLVQAIKWAPGKVTDEKHFEKYIEATMRRFCRDYINCDHLIKVPRSAFRKRLFEKGEDADFSDLIITTVSLDQAPELGQRDTYQCEIDAFFTEHKITKQEQEIVWLLVAWYTVREIADIIGKSKSTTDRIIQRIREKCRKNIY